MRFSQALPEGIDDYMRERVKCLNRLPDGKMRHQMTGKTLHTGIAEPRGLEGIVETLRGTAGLQTINPQLNRHLLPAIGRSE